MNNSYLITLTPTGKFFFGGEMTFKVKGEGDKYNEQYSSYIIAFNRMPQQTSLLGMLRFLLLRNAGGKVFRDNKIQSQEKAKKLIGQSSFKVSDKHEVASYGKIDSITPCFLMEGNTPVPVFCKIKPETFDMSETTKATFNAKAILVPKNTYCAKDLVKNRLDDYFKEDQRMGLDKAYDGKKRAVSDDETHLFKQTNLRLNDENHKDLKFAFYAKVDSDIPLTKYNGQLVSVGADGSAFVIGIKSQAYQPNLTEEQTKNLCVVLSSPAFLDFDKLDHVAFATTSVIPFRFLSTTVDTESYDRLSRKIGHGKKYNLYDTGSVFYFENEEKRKQFTQALEGYEDFRQIGYNYYIIND